MKRYVVILAIVAVSTAVGKETVVSNSTELSAALRSLEPGATVLIEPGTYRGGLYVSNAVGRPGLAIVISGRDTDRCPEFVGGGQAFHLADCSHLVLKNLKVRGFPSNGINIDDGGSFETPSHHITVENVTILNTGPQGNHDALKMSGVDHFAVRKCRFEGWGGSGIDMVGCHNGVVEDCTFVGRDGFSQSNAIQLKGGTSEMLVHCNLFKDAGQRAINLGGSTGLEFFRPKVDHYEASKITVAGNRFIGGMAPLAWATADGGHVHHNTIVLPHKWALRILQETKDTRFRPCHDGVFEKNIIVFDSKVSVFVNVGAGTAPQTFRFRENIWYDTDGKRRPQLPTAEQDGYYQPDMDIGDDGVVTANDERLKQVGAGGYVRPR